MSAGCRELTVAELDLVAGGRYIPGWGWEVSGSSHSGDWGLSNLAGWASAADYASGAIGAAGVGVGLAAGAQMGADLPMDAIAVGLGTASLGLYITGWALGGLHSALQ